MKVAGRLTDEEMIAFGMAGFGFALGLLAQLQKKGVLTPDEAIEMTDQALLYFENFPENEMTRRTRELIGDLLDHMRSRPTVGVVR